MQICKSCDYTVKNGPINDSVYCPGCGNRLVPGSATKGYEAPVIASRPVRLAAGLIDFSILFVLLSIGIIPGVNIVIALIVTAFWLLRDMRGASPGKALMRLEVRTMGGGKPSPAALMLRNLPFCPLILSIIPVIGAVTYFVDGSIFIVEFALVLLFNRRVGDYLARTKVMKRDTEAVRVSAASAS